MQVTPGNPSMRTLVVPRGIHELPKLLSSDYENGTSVHQIESRSEDDGFARGLLRCA